MSLPKVAAIGAGPGPTSKPHRVDPRDEGVVGDVLDRGSVAVALNGVRYRVSTAAETGLARPPPNDIHGDNVEGQRHVIKEALRAGVEHEIEMLIIREK